MFKALNVMRPDNTKKIKEMPVIRLRILSYLKYSSSAHRVILKYLLQYFQHGERSYKKLCI